MITFSRCPIVLYPLTFLSEENSRWTAAAPSQMPFPPPYAPPDRKPNGLKQGQKGCVTLRASASTTDFRSWLFDVPHYLAEKAVCSGHYISTVSLCLCLDRNTIAVPFLQSLQKVFQNSTFSASQHTIMHKCGSTYPEDKLGINYLS